MERLDDPDSPQPKPKAITQNGFQNVWKSIMARWNLSELQVLIVLQTYQENNMLTKFEIKRDYFLDLPIKSPPPQRAVEWFNDDIQDLVARGFIKQRKVADLPGYALTRAGLKLARKVDEMFFRLATKAVNQ